MSFSDVFKKVGKFTNSDEGSGLMNLLGLGVAGYGLYKKNQAINRRNDLIKEQNRLAIDNYNYNKALNDREVAKNNMLQNNFSDGFASVFGEKKKKKKLDDYYGNNNYEG